MEYDLVVLDMDGTLADTAPGIIASFMHIAHEFDRPEPSLEVLYNNCVGSLSDNLARIYDLDRDEAERASVMYRRHYGTIGYLQARMYPGMEDLVRDLRAEGVAVGVATMKIDEYAKRLVEHWGIADLFVDVCGADVMGRLSKSDLIDRCIYSAGATPGRTLMVGDTTNDLAGARGSGTDFMAVTFGYGFKPEWCRENGVRYAETPSEILDAVRGR